VTKYFGAKRAVYQVSLALHAGDRIALVGDNGSGKSTLLAIASGALDPDDGRAERPGSTGYAPERPDLPDHLLVSEWLDVVASLKRARGRDIAELGIEPLLGRRVSALSSGQRQRVSLAAALLGDPALLVLDEPTNALDADARAFIIGKLRASTLLFATHDQELIENLGARVVRMTQGRLTPAALTGTA
jgi:ABC-type multidrug transport system ATPase subunit